MALILEPQAKVLYNILGAIFDHADGYFEPKGIGLWTMEKERAVMVETDQAELVEVYKIVPGLVFAEQYKIMGCPIYLIPTYEPEASPFVYREPDQPALTRPSWIKMQVICLHFKDNDAQYKALQTYIAKFDLRITDPEDKVRFPGGRYLALPTKSTVEWYAKSLGGSLGLGDAEDIKKRMEAALVAWVESEEAKRQPPPPPVPTPAPAAQGMTQEQFLAQKEEMLSTEREIELLAMATRMADQQTRRNIESANLINGYYTTKTKYLYDF